MITFLQSTKVQGTFLDKKFRVPSLTKSLGYIPEKHKVQGKTRFMFFDTNKIHIQAFLFFINGKLIIFRSSSPEKYFEDIYSKNISKKQIQKINTKTKFKKRFRFRFRIFSKFLGLKNPQIIFFHDDSIYFPMFLEVSRPSQS